LALIYDFTEKRSWIVLKLSLFHGTCIHLDYSRNMDDQLPFVDVYFNSLKIVDTVFGVGGINYSDVDRPFLFRNLMVD
jgi:hypothetical protein